MIARKNEEERKKRIKLQKKGNLSQTIFKGEKAPPPQKKETRKKKENKWIKNFHENKGKQTNKKTKNEVKKYFYLDSVFDFIPK